MSSPMDTKLWRCRASSTLLVGVFYTTAVFLSVLSSQTQVTNASRSYASKSHQEVASSSEDEVAAEFMSWVASVGAAYGNRVRVPANQNDAGVLTKVVTPQVVFYVDVAGFGNFKTVQEAVNAVPDDNSMPVLIVVKAGTYRERVIIPKSKAYITMQGAGRNVTWIEYDMNAASAGSTYDSASVSVFSDHFVARDISFKNSAPAPPAGAVNQQAVALRITGDYAAFYNCGFYGSQDTLNDDMGRHYYKNCEIVGSIDFIFGDAQSLYKDCALNVNAATYGSVTAQKRESNNVQTGFSFVGCSLNGSGQVYLGRAWGPYSRVVFAFTFMQDIVIREGWDSWNSPDRQRTAYYGQYKCSGPGATELGRVAWSHELSDAEAAPFLSLSFIDGQDWYEAGRRKFNAPYNWVFNCTSNCYLGALSPVPAFTIDIWGDNLQRGKLILHHVPTVLCNMTQFDPKQGHLPILSTRDTDCSIGINNNFSLYAQRHVCHGSGRVWSPSRLAVPQYTWPEHQPAFVALHEVENPVFSSVPENLQSADTTFSMHPYHSTSLYLCLSVLTNAI